MIYLLCAIFLDIDADDEWKEWQKLGDPVLHIDLRGKSLMEDLVVFLYNNGTGTVQIISAEYSSVEVEEEVLFVAISHIYQQFFFFLMFVHF